MNFQKIKNSIHVDTISASSLIIASMLANVMNFLYNAYLGRAVSFEEFGVISLIGSFLFFAAIPLGSLSKTVVYQIAYILGKHKYTADEYWSRIRKKSLFISLAVTLAWILASPFLAKFFQTGSVEPFLIFAPIWILSTMEAVDRGFVTGGQRFTWLSILVVLEAFARLVAAWILVSLGFSHYVYAAVPISMTVSTTLGWWYAIQLHKKTKAVEVAPQEHVPFSTSFLTTSVLTKISGVTFLSLDSVLAKHFLAPHDAGQYAFISLVGNMIFYLGDLFGQFMTPVIAKQMGANTNSRKTFYLLMLCSCGVSLCGYIGVGIFGFITIPFLFGAKTAAIVPLLPIYCLAMLFYTVTNNLITFHQIRQKNIFPLTSVIFASLEIFAISVHHANLIQIVFAMVSVSFLYMITIITMHIFQNQVDTISRNLSDFFELFFGKKITLSTDKKTPRILIFNWRDTRHKWAGGAEVYIHEIAKRLVQRGYKVTLFCGNDGDCPRNEVVDGVQVIRRGGFYTVYIWAFLYYVLRFRGLFDVIIDSENGIPFFTPLYVGRPVIGVIYHVHQEVFSQHLRFPLAQLAMFLEAKVAPVVYRKIHLITISQSTATQMIKHGLSHIEKQIEIITPGIDPQKFAVMAKNEQPTLLYFGRLKPYKSIDVVIRAMPELIKKIPNIRLLIAGEGESRDSLGELVKELQLQNYVKFVGKVSEKERSTLMAQAWVVVQPSKIEGWGITNIEANASGTPVVAANVAGLRDSVIDQQTGFLVKWGNVTEFAAKIEELILNHDLRKKFEQNGLAWAEKFSWDRSADQLEKVINRLAS